MESTMVYSRRGSGIRRKPLARGRTGQESGFVIVLTLLVLMGLTIMGMTVIMGANIETRIAGNENSGERAFFAADAGLNQAISMLNNGDLVLGTAEYANAAWGHPTDRAATYDDADYVLLTQPNGTSYRWRMQFKLDSGDLDGDGDTGENVYYNHAFKYLGSKYTGATAAERGYPVIEIESDGYSVANAALVDRAERRLKLDIGRDKYKVIIEGAVTARSDVTLTGSINISGNNHDESGAEGGSCGTDLPGVFVDIDKGIILSGAQITAGNPPTQVSPDARYLPATPWDALGLDNASELPDPQTPAEFYINYPGGGDISGYLYVTGDIDVGDTAAGETVVLVVHNPLFNAEVYECSVPRDENGVANPKYDNAPVAPSPCVGKYDPKLDNDSAQFDTAYRADRQPAVLAMHGNDIFKGIIIADKINAINGTSDIIGAIVSLTSVGADILGNGAANIKYSCDVVAAAASLGYSTKLSWRRE